MQATKEAVVSCWICGSSENLTGEHIFKHSDAKMLLGPVSQQDPVFFHTAKRINKEVGSFKNSVFKFGKIICAKCNGQITQPYDRAWDELSKWLYSNSEKIEFGKKIRWSNAFPYSTRAKMIDVQLFFSKLMGCCLETTGLNFDRKEFSESLLKRKINPSVYLKINVSKNESYGVSDLVIKGSQSTKTIETAAWSYQIGKIHIHVFYRHDRKVHRSPFGEWHPKQNSNVVVVQSCL